MSRYTITTIPLQLRLERDVVQAFENRFNDPLEGVFEEWLWHWEFTGRRLTLTKMVAPRTRRQLANVQNLHAFAHLSPRRRKGPRDAHVRDHQP